MIVMARVVTVYGAACTLVGRRVVESGGVIVTRRQMGLLATAIVALWVFSAWPSGACEWPGIALRSGREVDELGWFPHRDLVPGISTTVAP